jgi:hypothetical protein
MSPCSSLFCLLWSQPNLFRAFGRHPMVTGQTVQVLGANLASLVFYSFLALGAAFPSQTFCSIFRSVISLPLLIGSLLETVRGGAWHTPERRFLLVTVFASLTPVHDAVVLRKGWRTSNVFPEDRLTICIGQIYTSTARGRFSSPPTAGSTTSSQVKFGR